jgi:hypothetical protein
MSKNPMQPVLKDSSNVIRFKQNEIVRQLLELSKSHGFGLNEIGHGNFTLDDQMQFAQLIGYSVSGYGDLSYVDAVSCELADQLVKKLMNGQSINSEQEIRLKILEEENQKLKAAIRFAAVEAFRICPEDLE